MSGADLANIIIAAVSVVVMAAIYVYNDYAWKKLRRRFHITEEKQ